MPKHHSNDFKLSAVRLYQKHKSYSHVARLLDCDRISLMRWVKRYKETGSIERQQRPDVAYKVRKNHVKYALELLEKDQQISMKELAMEVKRKYPDFNVTPRWLGTVVRDNNLTRKRTRVQHRPEMRYGVAIDFQREINMFKERIRTHDIDRIIHPNLHG